MLFFFFFFFNDTATTEIYTLSLHDALPIWIKRVALVALEVFFRGPVVRLESVDWAAEENFKRRSEEHTSELQSQSNLVCRLLLEKKKKITSTSSDLTANIRQPPINTALSSL